MFLAVDIGNTSITFGIFDGDTVKKIFFADTSKEPGAYKQEILSGTAGYKISQAALISVSDGVEEALKQLLDDLFGIKSVIIDYKSVSGMKILTDHPDKTGMDRLVNAYFAKNAGKYPAVVIDAGTAITLDVVSKDGDFAGGVIMPGINMQLKALAENTSKLPLVEPAETAAVIGKNTDSSILSGVVRGAAYAVDGLLAETETELGVKPYIIITGGQGELLAGYMKTRYDVFLPDLTLRGIKSLYDIISL